MRTMGLAELTAAAEQIVVGEVLSTRSAWDAAHLNIYTTIDIRVQESWKGAPPNDGILTIRQLGGSVGEIEMTVYGMARFTAGERSLLFLHGARVVGMSQGKRGLRWDAQDRRWLVDAPDRAGVLDVDAHGRPHVSGLDHSEALDGLRERVRALVRN